MSEKPKKKPSRWMVWLIGIAVVIVIGCGLLFLYYAQSVTTSVFQSDVVNLDGEEARAFIESEPYSLPLPADAKDIYVHYTAWQDWFEYIRFSAKPEDIESWLNENDFCFKELIENEPSYFFRDEANLDWWQANEASRYAIAEQCGNDPFYELVIDQSNSDSWIVYIVVFTT